MTLTGAPSPPEALDAPIPLSANLELLCLFDKGDHEGAFGPRHLVALGWRVRGALDLPTLQGALDDVVARHEVLRTTIVRSGESAHQRVNPPSSPRLDVVELPPSDLSRDEQVDAFINEVEAGSLSVAELPHLRAVVGRFDDQDAVVVLVTHHTASDGWSLHVIMRDLAFFYRARRGLGDTQPPPMRQYRDFALWQQGALADPGADTARSYWKNKLTGSQILDIRADRRLDPDVAGLYSVHRFLIEESVTASVLGLARAVGCSPFMVLLSAFQVLLHQMTGVTDMVAPILTSGRKDPSFNDTVGPFFNMVPLRTDLTGCGSFAELVRRIKDTCLEAYEHELPFGHIVAQAPEIMGPYARDDGAVCAFQVLQFPAMTEAETVGDLEYEEVRVREMSFPTTSDIPNGVLWGLDILPGGPIAGTMRFNSLQFDPSTMHEMVESFLRILRKALADPKSPLDVL